MQTRRCLKQRVATAVYGSENQLARILADDGRAMALHQYDRASPEASPQRFCLRVLRHQMIGRTELVALIPDRHLRAEDSTELGHHAEFDIGQTERHDRRTMVMTDRMDIRAHPVQDGVDHTLRIQGAVSVDDRLCGHVKFEDIGFGHQLRRH